MTTRTFGAGLVGFMLISTTAFAYDNASVFTPGLLGAEILHEEKSERTLITNVHVFDGKNESRIMSANVLIEGKFIKEISNGNLRESIKDFIASIRS